MKRERAQAVEKTLSKVKHRKAGVSQIDYRERFDYDSEQYDEIASWTVTSGLEDYFPETVKDLRDNGFLVFHPVALSNDAKIFMSDNSDKSNYYTRLSGENSARTMIVDPQQERKTKELADSMIRFFYSNRGVLREYNKKFETDTRPRKNRRDSEKAICENGFDPEASSELRMLLNTFGFSAELMEGQPMLVVEGDGFSLQVDVQTGKIHDPQAEKEQLAHFEKAHRKGFPGIRAAWEFIRSKLFKSRDSEINR